MAMGLPGSSPGVHMTRFSAAVNYSKGGRTHAECVIVASQ